MNHRSRRSLIAVAIAAILGAGVATSVLRPSPGGQAQATTPPPAPARTVLKARDEGEAAEDLHRSVQLALQADTARAHLAMRTPESERERLDGRADPPPHQDAGFARR